MVLLQLKYLLNSLTLLQELEMIRPTTKKNPTRFRLLRIMQVNQTTVCKLDTTFREPPENNLSSYVPPDAKRNPETSSDSWFTIWTPLFAKPLSTLESSKPKEGRLS